MKFATVFQIIAVLSAAPSAMGRIHGNAARAKAGKDTGRVKAGKGRGGGTRNGDNQDETVIVEIKKDKENGTATLARSCEEVADVVGGEVIDVFDQVLNGCAIRMSSQATAAMAVGVLSADPRVMLAEPDQPVYTSAVSSWGLDRVNQCSLPLDSTATKVNANGVRVYIVDTGIYGGHADFSGMITPDSDCHKDTSGGSAPLTDGNGHGTHVAGTVCGASYGVAEGCDLCAVKVLGDNGSGTNTGVINGINHVVANCKAAFPEGTERKCVANMSLGGGFSPSLNTAVKNAVAAGVVMVVAAGNDNDDACSKSPASEETAITVGSTTISDVNSGFSNFGSCVDVYGPGSDITSAWIGGANAANTISGTSMASPHVAGIAAGVINEGVAPADVSDHLKATAKLLADKAQDGSDQWLATTVGGCQDPTPPPAPTAAPTPCTQSVVVVEITTDNYSSETAWTLENTCNGNQVGSGGSYTSSGTEYREEFCEAPAAFKFTISDTYGDGICCGYGQGGYKITVDGEVKAEGGDFGSSEVTTFGDCNAPPTATPTAAPTVPPTAPPTTDAPTKAPTNEPTHVPTNPPTNSPTSEPSEEPTPSPTPSPTEADVTYEPTGFPSDARSYEPTPLATTPDATTVGPTFFTCAQFNEANGMACTKAYGGGRCQWLGSCQNCGCVVVGQDD